MNTVIKKPLKTLKTLKIMKTKNSVNSVPSVVNIFVVSGFGQSRSEVRIMHPYHVERQIKDPQLTHRVIASISEAISLGISRFTRNKSRWVEESFCLSNYNFNKNHLDNRRKICVLVK